MTISTAPVTVASPVPVRSSAISMDGGWNWFSVLSVLVGALMHISFQAGGQFFGGEVLMLAMMPVLAFDNFYRRSRDLGQRAWLWRPLNTLLLALLVTFTGYLLSDLYRNNSLQDFMRGWARLFFLGVDLLVVSLLISINRTNFWLLVIGYTIVGAGVLVLQGFPFEWKFGYSIPVTVGSIAVICALPRLGVNGRGLALLALGLINVMLDYRSMGGFCAVVAVLCWLNHWAQSGRVKVVQIMTVATLAAILGGSVYYASQGTFAQRRQASNSMRLSSALVGFSAVLESPLIGYGSWGRDTRFAKLYADVQFRMNKTEESPLYDFDLIRLATIPAHSQFLEAWIEGGLLGLGFFIVYLVLLVRGLWSLVFIAKPAAITPLLGYFMICGLWAYFMSPFKGLTRMDITMACLAAIIACQMASERMKAPEAPRESA